MDRVRPWAAKIQPALPLSLEWTRQLERWRQEKHPFTLVARQPLGLRPTIQVFRWNQGAVTRSHALLSQQDQLSPQEPFAGKCLLVCTHGTRDRCCGTLGVKLVKALRGQGVEVWEVSHLGGHRFAPTLWDLAGWRLHGRMPLEDSEIAAWCESWRSDGEGLLDSLRGHAAYSPQLQVLEARLRQLRGEWPGSLRQVSESVVEVKWSDQQVESCSVTWTESLHEGPLSCRDLPDQLEVYTSYQVDTLEWLPSEGVRWSTGNRSPMSNVELNMTDQDLTLLRTLVALAWADGSLAPGEMEWIDKVMDQLQVDPALRQQLLASAPALPTEEDLQQALPDGDDRETFLRFLLSVSLEDGETSLDELKLLRDLASKLGVSAERLEKMRQSVVSA